ncbi:hypothetical protein FA95DRAFT_1606542 [Auriscalpium vulgare]|uniref:Uncharacterized protein n=1 Tax=Auriscalpium vulgare TaxID=40419 RepID=A0ACB8RSV8_9AGAM|nr:hypothetical protein FA95DRAFT_1606542 [Auriscalpium vulgare]
MTHFLKSIAVPGLALAAFIDIALASTLAFYLFKGRTGWKRSDTVVNKLILYTVTTGFVPAVDNVLTLIFFVVKPKTFYHQFFNFMLCRCELMSLIALLGPSQFFLIAFQTWIMLVRLTVYTNTFLATLNARASMRSLASNSTFGPQSLATVGIENGSAPKLGKVGRHGGDTLSTFQAVNVHSVQGGADSDFELKIPAGALQAGHVRSIESAENEA